MAKVNLIRNKGADSRSSGDDEAWATNIRRMRKYVSIYWM